MIATAIGTAVLALLAAWLFGGLLLRVAGALLILAGAVGLGSGDAGGALVLGIGALVWWAGHLLYALRHGAWKSPLAERLGGAGLAGWRRARLAVTGRENASQREKPRGV